MQRQRVASGCATLSRCFPGTRVGNRGIRFNTLNPYYAYIVSESNKNKKTRGRGLAEGVGMRLVLNEPDALSTLDVDRN